MSDTTPHYLLLSYQIVHMNEAFDLHTKSTIHFNQTIQFSQQTQNLDFLFEILMLSWTKKLHEMDINNIP